MWLRYLILLILVYLVVRVVISILSKPNKKVDKAKTNEGEEMVKDPNCNTYISIDSAIVGKVNGKYHYFCSKECLNAFKDKS